MVEDIVRELGLMTLGSRMRRIGERLQGDATRLAAARGATVQAGFYSLLGALERAGELTIGELATAVGITQPGVTRSIGELARQGLVIMRPGREDQRQRMVSLTPKGRAQVELGKREIWPAIEAAVADLCRGFAEPLLDHLAMIEQGLAERPLDQRARGDEALAATPGRRRA